MKNKPDLNSGNKAKSGDDKVLMLVLGLSLLVILFGLLKLASLGLSFFAVNLGGWFQSLSSDDIAILFVVGIFIIFCWALLWIKRRIWSKR